MLGFVARRLLAERVAMRLRGARPGRDGLRDLAGLPEMRLDGLSRTTPEPLLESVVPGPLDAGVRDRIVAETRGNPLALLELPERPHRGPAGGRVRPARRRRRAGPDRGGVRTAGRRACPRPRGELMLLAAADAVGDATLLWRAAAAAGIDT